MRIIFVFPPQPPEPPEHAPIDEEYGGGKDHRPCENIIAAGVRAAFAHALMCREALAEDVRRKVETFIAPVVCGRVVVVFAKYARLCSVG